MRQRRTPSAGRRLLAAGGVLLAASLAIAGATQIDDSRPADRSADRPTTTTAGPMPPDSPVTATSPAPPDSGALAAGLDPIWAATPAGCMSVIGDEGVVYERNPDAALVPASATKLVTAAAALDVLGEAGRLRTSVRVAEAPRADGVVRGDLWLVGGGDPVLGSDAWAAHGSLSTSEYTSLDQLADQVVAAGVRRVEGSVIGDESRYVSTRWVETWPARLIADGEVGPLSALTVNGGFRVWGHPGVTFSNPPVDAAELFAAVLRDRGVETVGAARAGPAAAGVDLAAAQSPAIGDLVHTMLRDSSNGIAEQLVKEMGLRIAGLGTTEAGTVAVIGALTARGIPVAGSVIADGSGLSDAARVTCRLLTRVLASQPEAIANRLAVAGRDGTLVNRLRGTAAEGRLRAKTGSLDGVAALAGYATTTRGSTMSFAYLINGLAHDTSARPLQDAFAVALAEALM